MDYENIEKLIKRADDLLEKEVYDEEIIAELERELEHVIDLYQDAYNNLGCLFADLYRTREDHRKGFYDPHGWETEEYSELADEVDDLEATRDELEDLLDSFIQLRVEQDENL